MKVLFAVSEKTQPNLALLHKRQRALVQSAINYHTLLNQNAIIDFHIYVGKKWQLPKLTDTTTINGNLTVKEGLAPATHIIAWSTIPENKNNSSGNSRTPSLKRHLLITPEDSTAADVELHKRPSVVRRVYSYFEETVPILFDEVREVQRRKREKTWLTPVETQANFQAKNSNFRPISINDFVIPRSLDSNAPKAALIGMHWLESGGAERWAMETIEIASKNGLLPIVVTDRESLQPWITSPILQDALILPLTPPMMQKKNDEPLLRALFEHFDIRVALIHHCQWLYDRLYWIKHFIPKCKVIDSLHILEYGDAGGYPHQALVYDECIDIHHVISPQLEKWLTSVHGIPSNKVIDAPLVGLTSDQRELTFKPRKTKNSLTVAFLGRIVRQKRPEAFVMLARKLSSSKQDYSFIMHGSGEKENLLATILKREGLVSSIERRGEDIPSQNTFRDADVLVVSSINEGITLTSIEAISVGIPVVSTNVGSQNTLIPDEALTGRSTRAFVSQCSKILERLNKNEEERHRLWTKEAEMLRKFSSLENANTLFNRLLGEWSCNE